LKPNEPHKKGHTDTFEHFSKRLSILTVVTKY